MIRAAYLILVALAFLLPSSNPPSHAPWQGPALNGPAPARTIRDPYPTFNGVAVDTATGMALFSDTNLMSLVMYDRDAPARPSASASPPRAMIRGDQTGIGFIAGVAVDPVAREVFAVNNDIEDTLVVFSYDDKGNVRPRRKLAVPHQAWGLALEPRRGELAVSVQGYNAVMVYRRQADALEAPVRSLRGPDTGMADPHGVVWDTGRGELVVANHGNFRGLAANPGAGCRPAAAPADAAGPGFQPPSITVYPAGASGNTRPLRTITGARTRLDWPMGVAVDSGRDEIVVANNGDSSVLFFGRRANGDVTPARVLGGPKTGIDRPMGVAVDPDRNELWVANFGNHTALVFPRDAAGDVAPKRIVRNAPEGAPTVGFGNPMGLAYDSKRDELLVPN